MRGRLDFAEVGMLVLTAGVLLAAVVAAPFWQGSGDGNSMRGPTVASTSDAQGGTVLGSTEPITVPTPTPTKEHHHHSH